MMRTHGFTLIEIMVAMLIFPIISVMTFQGLQATRKFDVSSPGDAEARRISGSLYTVKIQMR